MTNQEAINIIRNSNTKLQIAIQAVEMFREKAGDDFVESSFENQFGYTMQEARDELEAAEMAIRALEHEMPREAFK